MPRKPKTNRVPRTRANDTWTEAQFWNFLTNNIRGIYRKWPPKYEARKRAQIPYEGPDKRRKWSYQCADCGGLFKGTEINVDHIQDCGKSTSWESLASWMELLFCEVDGLQVLCKPCHRKKTNASLRVKDAQSKIEVVK